MLTKEQKHDAVEEIKERFDRSVSTVVIENRGMSADQVYQLRRKLREAGLEFKVSKNRLVRIAIGEMPIAGLGEALTGPNGIAYSFEDPMSPAKLIAGMLKDLENKLVIKGGTLFEQVLDEAGVMQVSKMPGRDEIYATILGGIKGPATNIAYSLTGLHQKLWGLFTAHAEKLEGNQAA